MNPVALVLLEAEITDGLVSRARQANARRHLPEPTEPAHFREFLGTLIADLELARRPSSDLLRLQHYDRRLASLGVALDELSFSASQHSAVLMPLAA